VGATRCRGDGEAVERIVKAKRIITPEQFDNLVAAIDVRYQTMVLLDIETGLRWAS